MRPRIPPPCVTAAQQHAAQGRSIAGYLLTHPYIDWALYLTPEQLQRAEAEAEQHRRNWTTARPATTKKKAS